MPKLFPSIPHHRSVPTVTLLATATAFAIAMPSWGVEHSSATAARVAGDPITLAEIDQRIPQALYQAQLALYKARRAALEDLVAERLIARAAAEAGETVDAFRTQAMFVDPTSFSTTDFKALFERLYLNYDAETLTPSSRLVVQMTLVQEREEEKEKALLSELRLHYPVEVMLRLPRAPSGLRVSVAGPQDLVRGAGPEAPVQLVVFSAFDCAYCAELVPILDRLEQAYPGQLRIIHRHAPLEGLDSAAATAAEASECAAEQGRFWDYHHAVFAGRDIEEAGLFAAANKIGLDSTAFTTCLTSRRHSTSVEADLAEAERVDVTGVPTLFLNGIRIRGAKPYDEIQGYIESELEALPTLAAQQIAVNAPGDDDHIQPLSD